MTSQIFMMSGFVLGDGAYIISETGQRTAPPGQAKLYQENYLSYDVRVFLVFVQCIKYVTYVKCMLGFSGTEFRAE